MTSIVIPLGTSPNNHIELRYALRSIEKHVNGSPDVFIVGERPEWIKKESVFHIPFQMAPSMEYKQHNIFNKTMAAVNDERVSDEFLFMNDDHFFCQDVEISEYPVYFKKKLIESIDENSLSYKNTLMNTLSFLQNYFETNAEDFMNYDIHTPILYKKEKLEEMSRMINKMPKNGFCLKTVYSYLNIYNVDKHLTDLKIKGVNDYSLFLDMIKDRNVFSCSDSAWKTQFKIYMNRLYPNKSKFEN